MVEVSTAKQMKNIDQNSGIESRDLMQNAAECLFKRINFCKDDYLFSLKNIVIVCGIGNNGGDGYALAILMHEGGYNVQIVAADRPVAQDALYYFSLCTDVGISMTYAEESDITHQIIFNATFIVDAMFGMGFSREIEEPYDDLIKDINESGAFVFSIDLPSGINCDYASFNMVNNIPMCVKADITSTFVMKKPAQVSFPGIDFCGDIFVEDIGIPPEVISEQIFEYFLPDNILIPQIFKKRDTNSHKGTYGTLISFCGSKNMTGAAALCAESAMRVGVGLVVVVSSGDVTKILQNKLNFPVFLPIDFNHDGDMTSSAAKTILDFPKADAIVIGCGLGTSPHIAEVVKTVLKNSPLPIVLDADGINAISDELGILKERTAPTVLTPHPGEMAHLCGCDISYVQNNRIKLAREFALKYNVTLVLKGAATIVASCDGRIFFNASGTPAMAKGGMGDVLSGVIGSLIAQKNNIFESCTCGVYLHGLAGELGEKKFSQYGLSPDDMPILLSKVIKKKTLHTML